MGACIRYICSCIFFFSAIWHSAKNREDEKQRLVVLAIEVLLPLIRDLDIQRVSGSHLSASYIHSSIQDLANDEMTIAHCADTIVDDEDESSKRPNHCIDSSHIQYSYSHGSCFGMLKIENSPTASQ
ncbi:hypothetical protein BDA99DRAFT_532150 [Phascolomyces articulosus]|uniref:Uncharacterized protein n=1 Tax=Phascolomyces articulosus TaxID=60185 RepID=A0AAD5KB63_9FUNG|nr:hypothetical protein BDA99DRAFT_532150 [Phascolomyces articulosus]